MSDGVCAKWVESSLMSQFLAERAFISISYSKLFFFPLQMLLYYCSGILEGILIYFALVLCH